jgi:hypothetical protein
MVAAAARARYAPAPELRLADMGHARAQRIDARVDGRAHHQILTPSDFCRCLEGVVDGEQRQGWDWSGGYRWRSWGPARFREGVLAEQDRWNRRS